VNIPNGIISNYEINPKIVLLSMLKKTLNKVLKMNFQRNIRMMSARRRGLSKQKKPSRQDMGTKSECFKKWKHHVEGKYTVLKVTM
jgi:hypothetical protein